MMRVWLTRFWIPAFWFAMGASFFAAISPVPPMPSGAPGDKVQHIAAFAVLTLLCCLAYRDAPLRQVFAWLLAFGAMIEVAQAVPAFGRSSEWLDLAADGAATAITLVVVALLRRAFAIDSHS